MGMNIGYLTANRTSAGDEVYTPFYAVEPLLEFLPMFLPKNKSITIWCPFDEEWSAFVQVFKREREREREYNIIRSSLKDGQDFFEYEPKYWDILISNPPFSKKDEILERVCGFNKPFALLLPVGSIQGQKRFKIFNNNIQLLCFDARINYHTKDSMQSTIKNNSFGSAYFCRDFLPTKLEFRKLNRYEKPLINIEKS